MVGLGIEQELVFSNLSSQRRKELDNENLVTEYRNKIPDYKYLNYDSIVQESQGISGRDLPF